MKFKLSTAGYFYGDVDRTALLSLGFTFRKWDEATAEAHALIIEGEPEIEINSMDELMAFVAKHGTLILDKDRITIYDDCYE